MKTCLQRFWWNHGHTILPIGVMVGAVVGLILLLYALERTACSAKWAEKASFSFYTGCMVDGIPEENVRVLMSN